MSPDRRSQSSGQTLPLFAIMVPGLLALMALGLDSAQLFLERREAQGAADLAALAGVRSLPDDSVSAKDDARIVGAAHGYAQAQIVPVTPFEGDASRIEVTVNTSVDTFFMGIFGQSTVSLSARAVAQAEWTDDDASGGGFAVFAMETGCGNEKSVDISGSDDFFIGRVHSNSDIHVSGSNNDFSGLTTYVCDFDNGGGGNTYDPAPGPAAVEPDPVDRTWGDLCPAPPGGGYNGPSDWDLASDGAWWVGGSKDSKVLNPGVYCTNGKVKLGDSDITIQDVNGMNGITFVGQRVEISGSNFILTPHKDNILFAAFANADDAMKISGSGGDWAGLIYAPNGVAELSGQANGQDRFDLSGGVIAERVKLNGSDAYIDGTIGAGQVAEPQQVIALVE